MLSFKPTFFLLRLSKSRIFERLEAGRNLRGLLVQTPHFPDEKIETEGRKQR